MDTPVNEGVNASIMDAFDTAYSCWVPVPDVPMALQPERYRLMMLLYAWGTPEYDVHNRVVNSVKAWLGYSPWRSHLMASIVYQFVRDFAQHPTMFPGSVATRYMSQLTENSIDTVLADMRESPRMEAAYQQVVSTHGSMITTYAEFRVELCFTVLRHLAVAVSETLKDW